MVTTYHFNKAASLQLALASTTRLDIRLKTLATSDLSKNTRPASAPGAFQIFVCASHNPRPCWNVQPGMAGLLRRDPHTGGACRDRTDDPLLAKQVLSQLS